MSDLTPGDWVAVKQTTRDQFVHETHGVISQYKPGGQTPSGVVIATGINSEEDACCMAAAKEMRRTLKSLDQPLLVAVDLAGQLTDDEQMFLEALDRLRAAVAAAEVEK